MKISILLGLRSFLGVLGLKKNLKMMKKSSRNWKEEKDKTLNIKSD